jgi:hypothetical protein
MFNILFPLVKKDIEKIITFSRELIENQRDNEQRLTLFIFKNDLKIF